MSSLLWGLLGAVLIGASDCTARVTSQRVSLLPLILCIMAIATAVLTAVLMVTDSMPMWHAGAWLVSAVSGALNILALFFLYKALAYGPVSVASPAASSFVVILVVLNALAGEPWTVYQAVAVVMVFIGVGMLSARAENTEQQTDTHHQYSKQWLRRTTLLGMGAAITIAFRFFFAQEANAILGSASALYLNRVFALITCAIALGVIPLLQNLRGNTAVVANQWPTGTMIWLVLMQGFFEMGALAAFLIGSEGDGRVAATIGFSTFVAATTLIAWLVLKEPVGWWRGLWIVFISVGVVLAGAG